MDIHSTHLLEIGMESQRDQILEAWRCDHCDGKGQAVVGCAITHAIYWPCPVCLGRGRKIKWDAIKELYNAVALEASYQLYMETIDKIEDEFSRPWFYVLNKSDLRSLLAYS